MLTELNVKDFGLMENIHLEMGKNFNVFTGETGAGKSMLIDALGLLLGGRASAEVIRHGRDKTLVEGVFSALPVKTIRFLEEEGYPVEDGFLLLSREVNSTGRNICRVQGRTVPLSLYRTFCEGLVDIHGQLEHQSLLRVERHRELLDRFAGEEHMELLRQVKASAQKYRELTAQERRLLQSESQAAERTELLRKQVKEIELVAPVAGEEEALAQERKLLQNSEQLMRLTEDAILALYDRPEQQAALELISTADKALSTLATIDPETEVLGKELNNLYYSLEDVTERLRVYRKELDFEPGRLEEIEQRLIALKRVHRFGADATAILESKDDMRRELETLNDNQEELSRVRLAKKDSFDAYNLLSESLSIRRGMEAERLEKAMALELGDLGMPNARVEVVFTPVIEPSPEGSEQIEFFFSANLGEPPKPLAKIASGGEMARIMLAFKSLLSVHETVDTFVFDEVDSGVGGTTINFLTDKLLRIAAARQVLCITHNARVAAAARRHFSLLKEVREERTFTTVILLENETVKQELARMMGDDEAARQMAAQLYQDNEGKNGGEADVREQF